MNYILIGAAGFVAPRHMRAIKETGGNLLAIMDKSDSVGVIDSYFPDAEYFSEFEVFDRHVQLIKRTMKIDYLVVCTPNYLHDAHIRYGLRNGMDVICEKPLVINYHNILALKELEQETGRRVYNILQLRLSPALNPYRAGQELPDNCLIELTYHTPRGKWYGYSWKGDVAKSGGLLYNIGIHFFDLLIYLFGEPVMFKILNQTTTTVDGVLQFKNALCRWNLSVDCNEPVRELKIGGTSIDLTTGFTDLHTQSYREILDGRGWGIDEASKAIKLLSE